VVAFAVFSCTVPFANNPGPIHDAEWSPSGKDFIAIQGKHPANAWLFRAQNCVPLFQFGINPRNTVRFQPQGRFVMLGGFGNLSGDMDFWDFNKKKRINALPCQDLDGAKTFQWAPDGRTFVTASLHPWRRVDNGYKVWSYAGELLQTVRYPVLFQIAIRPAPPKTYPDRPQSPRLQDKRLTEEQQKVAARVAETKKPYVPPHLRNRAAGSSAIPGAPTQLPSLAERLQQERAAVAGPRRLTQLEQQRAAGIPIGAGATAAPAPTPARIRAEKRRKKRAKQHEAKQQASQQGSDQQNDDEDGSDEESTTRSRV